MAIAVAAARWRAAWVASELLRDWAAERISKESGGVYQLQLGRIRFSLTQQRVSVDSISLATLAPVNADQAQPLPDLAVTLRGCRISGVNVFSLVRNAGLVAASFGCQSGTMAMAIPRAAPNAAPADTGGAPKPFLVFQRELKLPRYAPRIRIARVVFPAIAIDVRLPRARGTTRLELGMLQWSMGDLVIDPSDPSAAARPLFSKTIELLASDFVAYPARTAAVHVDTLRTSLTDSTIDIQGVQFFWRAGSAKPETPPPYRHTRMVMSVGRVAAQGIDYGALMAGLGVHARSVVIDTFRLDATADKRLPKNPNPPRRRTPQRWMADLGETLRVDSVVVRNSEIVYREHVLGEPEPGVMRFARLSALATNLSHFDGRRTTRDSMTLAARTYLQDAAPLDARFTIALDAPRFDMTYRGSLGAMPVTAFNAFVDKTGAIRIASGQVREVTFGAKVRNGLAIGTITPLFSDLEVSIRRGGPGLLGRGGVFGDAARGIASLAAKWTVREANPPKSDADTLYGVVQHAFRPEETLIAFLWFGLRDGMMTVVKK